MTPNLHPGDRVTTSTNRTGTILPAPWDMPHYHLVKFDTGETWWMRSDILQPQKSQKAAA